VDCQRVLDAVPREMASYIDDLEAKGTFGSDVRLAIDWSDLDATELDGSVGLRGCRIAHLPEAIARLQGSFEHYVEVERGQWLAFTVGPENPMFVPLAEVSPYLPKALMTTEDSSFYSHHGFLPRELKAALIKNLKAGYFRYGASSITMQTVKNVLLYREKTLSRKLQELVLTWAIEQSLGKDRIMEIYVNAIEYGPGIYGIGTAAQHYFGKSARDLTPKESAFFSSILPSPKARYRQYCAGTLTTWSADKIDRILATMLKRNRLTEEEYQDAMAQPLVFVKDVADSEQACNDRVSRAIGRARPTNPLKKR
jgi:membrane peptidoglycan carboxypeptidase